MRFFVGVTDNSWFQFHAENQPDEINVLNGIVGTGMHREDLTNMAEELR